MYTRVFKTMKRPAHTRLYSQETAARPSSGLMVGALVGAAGLGYLLTRQSSGPEIKNPMVEEKARREQTKSEGEQALEQKAEQETRDTTGLVDKDTDKVKRVWEEKEKQARRPVPSSVHEREDDPVWRRLPTAMSDPDRTDREARVVALSVREKEAWPQASPGNPMVDEKLSSARTKTDAELAIEAHAQDHVHDTSGLVAKDTKKVEPVWQKTAQQASDPSKAQAETKRWYDTGAEGIKNSLHAIHQTAQNEMQWAEQKMHTGLHSAQRGVNHVFGQTQDRLPAKFIVEHARGTEI
ncbi:hypothetical protein BY458DRAFT_525191, partial [Sporodiniella umbellata]